MDVKLRCQFDLPAEMVEATRAKSTTTTEASSSSKPKVEEKVNKGCYSLCIRCFNIFLWF